MKKEIGVYVDPAINYENAAESWASHLDKSFPYNDSHQINLCTDLMQALWRDIDKETIEAIQANPQDFAMRVDQYRHGLSIGEN